MAEQPGPERGEDEPSEFAKWYDEEYPDVAQLIGRPHQSLLAWLERARRARAREKVLVEALEAVREYLRDYDATKGHEAHKNDPGGNNFRFPLWEQVSAALAAGGEGKP